MSGKPHFPNLFSPIRLRNLELRNRIVSTGHSTGLTDAGYVGDRMIAYYQARARGGVGLMISGSTNVHTTSTSKLGQALNNWDDKVIPAYQRLADAVHGFGARMFIQLNHAGGHAGGDAFGGPPVAPSPFNYRIAHEAARVLDAGEIAEIVAAFAAAATRVRAGGLDGIEIHGGHGNLIQQFLSPLTNHREDDYGGETGRIRFACEVLSAVRAAIGDDFPLGLRYSIQEDTPVGLTLAMSARYLPQMVAAGRLDYVNITSGADYDAASLPRHYAPMYIGRQHMRPLARAARAMVSVPLLSVGRITDPRDAEDILAAGDADLIGMTRAMIADRDLPRKAMEGRLNSIRYCVGSNEGCQAHIFGGRPITCVQDPVSGREAELGDVTPAPEARTVVVVGGGVAGLEAARVARLRGHRVTLLERLQQFGGQIRWARMAPGREEIGAVSDYLVASATELGVDLRAGTEASAAMIAALAPDAVILATGAEPVLPSLADEYDRLISAQAALDGAMVGTDVVVFDQCGDMIAPTTAEWLAASGRRTWLVTPYRYAGHHVEQMTWRLLHERLLARDVRIICDHEVDALTDEGVDLRNVVSREVTSLPDVVTVVASSGGVARNQMAPELRALIPGVSVTCVGDAVSSRTIEKAIYEGHMAARAI